MSKLSGVLFVGMAVDGDVINGNLRTTSPLSQYFKKDTNTCVPDWTIVANQPTIYPVMRSQNEGVVKGVVAGSEKWYYNGILVVFDGAGVATSPLAVANKVKKITANNGTIDVPSLRIIGNLAAADNLDADVIRMVGNVEASGHSLAFDVQIGLEISEYTDSEYTGFLSATNGGIIDQEDETITVTPALYKGGSKMTSGFTVKWLKPPYSAVFSTANTLTLGRNDIDSRLPLMCQFVVNAATVDTRIITLSDEIDPYFISSEASGTATLSSQGVNSSVTFTHKVKKTGTGETIPGFTFTSTFTGPKGQAIVPLTPPTATGFTLTFADTQAAEGTITISTTATN